MNLKQIIKNISDILREKKYLIILVISMMIIFSLIVVMHKKNILPARIENVVSKLKFWEHQNQGEQGTSNINSNFTGSGELKETGNMQKSPSSSWWVNSGGLMTLKNDIASTVQGKLPKDSYWRQLYAKTNPKDTDQGYRPQNIFRLVTRQKWQNFSQQVYFDILGTNMSESDNRNESNGLLLFNRYQDGDNLYYTGIRVDGAAVIKKKIGGKYFTMDTKDVFGDSKTYDRAKKPNFLPTNTWIGLKSEIRNEDDGSVDIKLYMDVGDTGSWTLLLETKDNGSNVGDTSPITQAGHAGIRTDFMDVQFKNFSTSEL